MNILIGTPCYGGKLDLDYLNSILDFNRAKLPVTVMGIKNESLIPRGRNTIISYFIYLKQFTHLLFLDADISISADSIIRLMSHHKDAIGAPVRLKGVSDTGQKVYNVHPEFNYEKMEILQSVQHVGTAVFCLSRLACEKLAENASRYKPSSLTKGRLNELQEHYDIFKCGVQDGVYISEDYWVCHALQKLGIDVWVDWGIKTRHWGIEAYE